MTRADSITAVAGTSRQATHAGVQPVSTEGPTNKARATCTGGGLAPNRGWKEMFLFNDALNTFYLRLYGVRHMVMDYSDSEKGNPLQPHRLLFPINSKGSFICTSHR